MLGHLHTGGTSLQSLVERGDYGLFQFVTRHADYGTGQVTAFHRTVSHYYYFVQHLIVFLQQYVDAGGALYFHLFGAVADVRDYQCLSQICLDGVTAVDVGNAARIGFFHFDGGSYKWLTARF